MLRGEPIWHTSSTGPMSIPSSSEAVATSARNSPAWKRVSTRYRRSLERLPWCAATTSSPRRSPSWCASRSARLRVFTNTNVVRCSCTRVGDPVEDVAHLLRARDRFELTLRELDGEVERALMAAVDDRGQGPVADEQARHRLDRPLRGRQPDPNRAVSHNASSRSSVSARCAPRLSRATAWISSTMTVSTVRSAARPLALVTRRYSDSGVVTTKLGGVRTMRARCELGRVAGADRDFESRRVETELFGNCRDLAEWSFEVLGDVDREGLER